ncbi:hypothetical protein [Paracoccus sp. SSK6]|uniref:hypothetical protein n=1 Tax=Paracoccus sp. SSK6 TaxID=3143131 RepID=UPI00321BCA84
MTALDIAKRSRLFALEAESAFRFYEDIMSDPAADQGRRDAAMKSYRAALYASDTHARQCVQAVLQEAGTQGKVTFSDQSQFRNEKAKLVSETKGNGN